MLSAIDDKMEKVLSSEYWRFLILYLSGRCCWVYTTMEMTSNPWSVAKPETFHSLSLTTGLDCLLFNSPRVAFYLEKPPSGALKSRRTPGMPSLQEGYEGCRVERETRGRVSLDAVCVRDRTCPSLLQSGLDDIHTQTEDLRFYREMSMSLCCLTLCWQLGHKQIEIVAPCENR